MTAMMEPVCLSLRRETSAPPWAWPALKSYARLAAKLRPIGYDLVIDLHGQSRSAFLAFATCAPVRIGFDKGELTSMFLADKLNQVTQLTFSNSKRNIKLIPDLFMFTPPPGVDVIGRDSK